MPQKRVILSAETSHEVVKKFIKHLQELNIDLQVYNPISSPQDLENNSVFDGGCDFLIVKVHNDTSIDFLHYAKIHKIPTLNCLDSVLMIKNKVALDYALRAVFEKYSFETVCLPKSWTYYFYKIKPFRKWIKDKIPIVLKSHYQHEKSLRFNYLVRDSTEIKTLVRRRMLFLNYDVYIQQFIDSDGIDRKIYQIGDQVFGIKRASPIFIYKKYAAQYIDTKKLEREQYDPPSELIELSHILRKELNLNFFGFDLLKSKNDGLYYLVDVNDFPGFRGIKGAGKIMTDYVQNYLESS
jgi:glutathione synthase/RimK-type ligase-like ATP-grasp enzyme